MTLTANWPAPEFKTRFQIGYYVPEQQSFLRCPVYVQAELCNRNGKGMEFSFGIEIYNTRRRDMEAWVHSLEDLSEYFLPQITFTVSPEKLARINEIGKRWHLNGLQAGCEHQRAAGKHSAWMGESADFSGVKMGFPHCQVCGYSYGSQWLFEELPPEIIDEIKSWGKDVA